MELGAVHCIPGGDTVTSPTYHRIPRDSEEDREEVGRMGGRVAQDARRGDTTDM